jgi:SAM-dependent methyltransferase
MSTDTDSASRDRPELEYTGERLVPGAHPDHIVEAEHLARYEMVSALAAGRKVLDCASGAGYGSAILGRAGAASVEGVDVDSAAVAFATDRYGDVANFTEGDLLTLPFEDHSFGLAVCFETIEHVTDVERGLEELTRVLEPGGVLAISTPNRGVYREDNPFHITELTSDEFREALAARFANVAIYRQQVHMATLITDDAGQAVADPGTEIPGTLRKLAAQDPGGELYAMALASDGDLPPLSNIALLAGGVAVRHWQDAAAAWESRARHAEAARDANSIELGQTLRAKEAAIEELEALKRRIAASGRAGRKILGG